MPGLPIDNPGAVVVLPVLLRPPRSGSLLCTVLAARQSRGNGKYDQDEPQPDHKIEPRAHEGRGEIADLPPDPDGTNEINR